MKIYGRNILWRDLPSKLIVFLRVLYNLRLLKYPITSLRQYLNNQSPDLISLRSGNVIKLSSHSDDILTFFVVFLKKDYGYIDRNDVVIDIGANIGIFSMFSVLCGAKIVYAFEPSIENYDVLCENIKHNNIRNVIPISKAVTDSDDEKTYISKHKGPYGQAYSQKKEILDEYHIVETITLDNFIEKNAIQFVDLVKIDCEGAEFQIIPSTQKSTFKKIKSIRMEVHGDPGAIVSVLCENSFKVHITGSRKPFMLWAENINICGYVKR